MTFGAPIVFVLFLCSCADMKQHLLIGKGFFEIDFVELREE